VPSLGERIHIARRRKGLSQQELAELVGVKPNTISRLEIGKVRRTDTDTLTKLCRALDVTPSFLLALDDADDPGIVDPTGMVMVGT